MKTEVLSIKEFLSSKEKERFSAKVERHFKKHRTIYKIAGITLIILVAGGGFDYAFASNGIDLPAKKLYYEIVNIGKWIIVFKGAVDTIKAVGDGDAATAKKAFISSLLTYLLLLGLPYGMDKVDEVFRNIKHA